LGAVLAKMHPFLDSKALTKKAFWASSVKFSNSLPEMQYCLKLPCSGIKPISCPIEIAVS